MRAIVSFTLNRSAQDVMELLEPFGWDVSEPEGSETWVKLVSAMPPIHAFQAQRTALELQRVAEQELQRIETTEVPTAIDAVKDAQHAATAAQETAIERERALLTNLFPVGANGVEAYHESPEPATIQRLAAREARRILDQIAAEDRAFADLTFQRPIYDRRTLTWGTVHYEEGKPHVVIRLRNSHSERLKLAVQRLAEHLIEGQEPAGLTARISVLRDAAIRGLQRVWFRRRRPRSVPISFDTVKVLEPSSATEALSGNVISERTLGAVLRERRGDLKIASVFLSLGILTLLAASPLGFDFDHRLHELETWDNGWLAWLGGNWSRLATSIFVVAFLPLVQLLLYWREVRRRPVVRWNVE